ncbi:uncharacterized protein LOC131015745 [Salvia miltiorrhiza]|uniref:uncharacterized protein LOC131015745 n=1 Tax=Salvia miltiorrhiza TaxID=226208 RepID=UPI0025AD07D0|nr:uncharacterized protein LOC131015745 [Salvia miltiorrhiza]
MNDVQKEAVKSLGFGSVLDLTIQEMPSKLDYWVLDCFHARRSEIVLPSGKTIEVTDEDAYRVLGFPRGDRSLELLDKSETTDLYDEWVSCFPDKNQKTIKISDVKDAMIASVDGGRWFKLHFLVMVTHCLIESTTHGSVIPRVIKSLDDLTAVRDFNWCEYVVDSLVESKGKWEKDTQSMYTGPIMFLAVFYVDRVTWARVRVSRSFPLFKNWCTKKLKDRELDEINCGRFGDGIILDPIEVEDESITAIIGKKLKMFERVRDEILLAINSADEETLASNEFILKFKEAKNLLLHAPITLTALPIDKVINCEDGNVEADDPSTGDTSLDAEVAHEVGQRETSDPDTRTPDQNIAWFDDVCIGATQLMEVDPKNGVNVVDTETEGLVNASSKGALIGGSTGSGGPIPHVQTRVTDGSVVVEEQNIRTGGGSSRVPFSDGIDAALGTDNSNNGGDGVNSIVEPAVGSAISKSAEVGGQTNLEVGCEADVVLGDALQTGRLAMTNIAKRGKENFVFENPKNVVKRLRRGRI